MNHKARKRFGQNFLIDNDVICRICEVIKSQAKTHNKHCKHCVEIGPGLGAITNNLVNSFTYYDAIEIDRDLCKILQQQYKSQDNFILHSQDVLCFDFNSIFKNSDDTLCVIGNLPYNITTPLLFHVFEYLKIIDCMFFMVQKEVADRLIADVNTKDYGRLSITAQYYARIDKLFDVPNTAFSPQPQVTSSIIALYPKNKTANNIYSMQITKNETLFFSIVKEAFNQRRKTINNSLKKLIQNAELQELNINPQLRAEQLSLEQYIQISNYLYNKHDV